MVPSEGNLVKGWVLPTEPVQTRFCSIYSSIRYCDSSSTFVENLQEAFLSRGGFFRRNQARHASVMPITPLINRGVSWCVYCSASLQSGWYYRTGAPPMTRCPVQEAQVHARLAICTSRGSAGRTALKEGHQGPQTLRALELRLAVCTFVCASM